MFFPCCLPADRAALVNIGAFIAETLCVEQHLRIHDTTSLVPLSWPYFNQVAVTVSWKDPESGMPALITSAEVRTQTAASRRRKAAFAATFFKLKGQHARYTANCTARDTVRTSIYWPHTVAGSLRLTADALNLPVTSTLYSLPTQRYQRSLTVSH